MLTQLTIQNFAIVKFLELEFSKGMTTITGETGAGKSIAIDALGLCLGARAEAAMVRPGAAKLEISARFNVSGNPHARRWLQEHELDEEEECIVRRTLTAEGRSRAYVNATPVPLQQLRTLGERLVSIHGQHAHQLLTKPEHQLVLLDEYAGHHDLLRAVRHGYQDWKQLDNEHRHLLTSQSERDARVQLLEYQVQELDEFALQPGELEQIEAEHKRLANSTALVEESQIALQYLIANEEVNTQQLLQSALSRVEQLQELDPALEPLSGMLNEALIQIEEAGRELEHYLNSLEIDPQAFHELDQRLSQAMTLARKHGVNAAELPELHQQLAEELRQIDQDGSRLEQLQEELKASREQFVTLAHKLSQSRSRYAAELSERITASMRSLSMEHACFDVQIASDSKLQLSPLGVDRVEFLVSTNPGQPLQSLGKIASGGELSRISLAIQVITAHKVATPTLIFDEVDVGISGPTAAVVGKLLRLLGEQTQVLCVTHLPQVAGNGHHQMFVSKHTDGTSTETTMIPLCRQKRLNELARLLGGDSITGNTLANAEELLID